MGVDMERDNGRGADTGQDMGVEQGTYGQETELVCITLMRSVSIKLHHIYFNLKQLYP